VDLHIGAARQNRRIVDLPIRDRERACGTSNTLRWRGGWLLWRITWFAFRRLKAV
jgi:hypothetical protein